MLKKLAIGFGATVGVLVILFIGSAAVVGTLQGVGVLPDQSRTAAEPQGTDLSTPAAILKPTPTSKPTDTPQPTPTPIPEISAAELHREYDANPIAGDLKYKGQVIVVHGTIFRISGDLQRTIELGPEDPSTFLGYLSCTFDRAYLPNLINLAKGQPASFKGEISGRGVFGTVQLKHCSLAP